MTLSQDNVSTLKKLWGAGLSAFECGLEIGLTGEPSEVREIVLRAIEKAAKPEAPPPKAKVPVSRSNLRGSVRAVPRNDDPDFKPEKFVGVAAAFDRAIPVEQRKTLLQLTEKTCHWPVGEPREPGFFFCGGDAVEDEAYCSFHCRVAYNGHLHRRRAA